MRFPRDVLQTDQVTSLTLPETNKKAPENRASQKENSSSNHWFSGDMLVLGSVSGDFFTVFYAITTVEI